ncbi:unnamed protein product [Closterium sp. NIES-54]
MASRVLLLAALVLLAVAFTPAIQPANAQISIPGIVNVTNGTIELPGGTTIGQNGTGIGGSGGGGGVTVNTDGSVTIGSTTYYSNGTYVTGDGQVVNAPVPSKNPDGSYTLGGNTIYPNGTIIGSDGQPVIPGGLPIPGFNTSGGGIQIPGMPNVTVPGMPNVTVPGMPNVSIPGIPSFNGSSGGVTANPDGSVTIGNTKFYPNGTYVTSDGQVVNPPLPTRNPDGSVTVGGMSFFPNGTVIGSDGKPVNAGGLPIPGFPGIQIPGLTPSSPPPPPPKPAGFIATPARLVTGFISLLASMLFFA